MSSLDNLPRINTNKPRETLVYSADGLVIKRPGPQAPDIGTWLMKQRHAQLVAQDLRAANNTTYFVPKMLEISKDGKFAVEERVSGHPLKSSYFVTLSPEDHDIIYRGFANFVNDINQMRPIFTQSDFFDGEVDEDRKHNMSLAIIIHKLKLQIKAEDLQIVTDAQHWFEQAAKTDASVVFSHGDMNENNIFYDPKTKTLSIIDFADAKYENAHYMFNRDLARLGWLDIDRLVSEYKALPRKSPVIVETNPDIENLRIKLKNFAWTATSFLKNPKIAPVMQVKMINECIRDVKKAYDSARQNAQFSHGRQVLKDAAKTNVAEIASAIQNQK